VRAQAIKLDHNRGPVPRRTKNAVSNVPRRTKLCVRRLTQLLKLLVVLIGLGAILQRFR
jgi:hypothetical protein